MTQLDSEILEKLQQIGIDVNSDRLVFKDGELTSLDCSDLGLSELPDVIASLKSLQSLDLRNNKFTQVPEVLRQLPETRFYLDNNQLETLPPWIFSTGGLVQSYRNNKLKIVPLEILSSNWLQMDLRENPGLEEYDMILANTEYVDMAIDLPPEENPQPFSYWVPDFIRHHLKQRDREEVINQLQSLDNEKIDRIMKKMQLIR